MSTDKYAKSATSNGKRKVNTTITFTHNWIKLRRSQSYLHSINEQRQINRWTTQLTRKQNQLICFFTIGPPPTAPYRPEKNRSTDRGHVSKKYKTTSPKQRVKSTGLWFDRRSNGYHDGGGKAARWVTRARTKVNFLLW